MRRLIAAVVRKAPLPWAPGPLRDDSSPWWRAQLEARFGGRPPVPPGDLLSEPGSEFFCSFI